MYEDFISILFWTAIIDFFFFALGFVLVNYSFNIVIYILHLPTAILAIVIINQLPRPYEVYSTINDIESLGEIQNNLVIELRKKLMNFVKENYHLMNILKAYFILIIIYTAFEFCLFIFFAFIMGSSANVKSLVDFIQLAQLVIIFSKYYY